MRYLEIKIDDPHDVSAPEIIYLINYFEKQIKLYKDLLVSMDFKAEVYRYKLPLFISEITLLKSLIFHLTNYIQRKEYKNDTILNFARFTGIIPSDKLKANANKDINDFISKNKKQI